MTACPHRRFTGAPCGGTVLPTGCCSDCGRAEDAPELPALPENPHDLGPGELLALPQRVPRPPEERLIDPDAPLRITMACSSPECGITFAPPYTEGPVPTEGHCPVCGKPYSYRPELAEGATLRDQYRIMGPIAHGGQGWVYLAEDTHLGDVVAVKGLLNRYEHDGAAAQREVLLSKVQAGEPPDIVIMPGIGELAEYADQHRLKRLNGLYDPHQYGSPWNGASGASRDVYWVPVKADLKSIVWYRQGHRPTNSPAPLQSWCLGMGDDGASGWPGTDWIEDLVLQREGPGIYGKWALGKDKKDQWWTSAPVRNAWEAWARPFQKNKAAAAQALLTDHRGAPGSHGLLFGGRRGCTLEHQGSFARSFYGEADSKRAELMDSAPLLPGGPDQVRAHEVTGDFAALFSDRRQAKDLIERLASKEGQQQWAEVAHVFSANRQVHPQEGLVEDEIAERLAGDGPRCLDASDVMAPAVRDAFYEAVLLTLARAAADQDPDIPGLLEDIQAVQDTQPGTSAAPKTVCSTQ